MLTTIQEFVEDAMFVSQGGIPMLTEGMLRISGARGVRSYPTFSSDRMPIGAPAAKPLWKYIDPNGRR